MTQKDKRIIDDCERDNIPMFVLTAKDMNAQNTIADYLGRCIKSGCNPAHLHEIIDRITEFGSWMHANPGKVKIPD